MERSERVGLGVAVAAHLALLAALSLHVATRPPTPVTLEPPIDVQLVDAIGAQSASPVVSREAAAPSAAPETGPPEEAAPAPDATPAPAPPKPAPPPPEPTPQPPLPRPPLPKPSVPRPEPAPPKPAPPKPEPKPAPKPKPVAEKPTPAKPAPAKPTPARPAPAKPTPAKAALAQASPAKAAPARPAGAPSAKPSAAPAAKPGAGTAAQTRGGIASDDFLKGITPEKSPGKAQAPRAQAVSQLAMNGLAAAIKRQIQPCYELGSLGGTPAMSIVTTLNLRFNKDGTVAGTPTRVDQRGVTDANAGYAKQIEDVGRRAVLRCAPLKLPPELFAGGWENLNFRFTPGQMQ